MKILMLTRIAIALLMLNATSVNAEIFKSQTFVEADGNGVVIVKGGDGIVSLTQYCTEDWADGCGVNVKVKRTGNSFVLDKSGLADHQNAFNFNNASGGWLLIPDRRNVTTGRNIEIKQTRNGACFIYTGPIPK